MWTHTSRARETRDDAQHTIHTLSHGTTHTLTRHDAHSHTARHTLSHGSIRILSRNLVAGVVRWRCARPVAAAALDAQRFPALALFLFSTQRHAHARKGGAHLP